MLQKRVKKRIGQILVEANMITEAELNRALKRQDANGQSLGKNLTDLGYIDGDEITQYIAEQYRIPYVSLDRYELRKDLLSIIPEHISKTYGLIPLDLLGDILTVGMVDAPDENVLRRLEELSGFKIQIMLVTAGDFNQYMQNMERTYSLFIVDSNNESGEIKVGSYIRGLSYKGRERRRFQRFNKELKIKYESKDEYNMNPSINVSQGGVLIKSKSPVPVNSYLMVRMELPASLEDIIIISRVVRVRRVKDGVYLIALNFSGMDTRDSRRLTEFLKPQNKNNRH